MRAELLSMSQMTLEGKDGGFLYDLDLFLLAGQCICLAGAVHQREVLVEYLSGRGRAISGRLKLSGKELGGDSRKDMERQRIFAVGCDTPYLKTLTIGENIFVLRRNSLKKFKLNQKAMDQQADYYIKKYGIVLDVDTDSARLTLADRFLVSIVRCVSQGARVLILHDASRCFSKRQSGRLLTVIERLKAEGIGLIVSDNQPEYFFSVADQLVVLKHRQIARKISNPADFNLAREIIMRGVDASPKKRIAAPRREGTAAEISGVLPDGLEFHLDGGEGEIVLVTGESRQLEGLWQCLMEFPAHELAFLLDGRLLPCRSLAQLIRSRVAFIDPDVSHGGVLKNLSAADNILMPSYPRISSRLGFFGKRAEYILGDSFLFLEGQGLRGADLGAHGARSVFYRWKLYHPRVLLTHNVLTVADAREQDWIKAMIGGMAARGTVVFLLENEASCCDGLADRIETLEERDER